MTNPVSAPLINSDEIQSGVQALGAKISKDYQNRKLTLLVILKGAFVFASDLIRSIDLPQGLEVNFMALSSYEGIHSTGTIDIKLDAPEDLEGKDILIIEDIVDTGLTVSFLQKHLEKRKPASIKVASCLLRASAPEDVKSQVDYHALTINDDFVVGYGLDYNQRFRESKDLLGLTFPDH